ncbi:MAG: TatD family hydrolase [Gammaproteobacteria bacterium]|nr:TatD family hydrolase [Gammaproteobacteria bacterium]
MNKYIDIGVNLTGSSFKKDVAKVIGRAQQVGVTQMIVTGTNLLHSEQAIQLTQHYDSICYATVGIHPHDASEYSSDTVSELRDMLQQNNVVAVGECGLDYNRNFSSRKEQIHAFEAQLELAIELQKPIFLHQRDAHDDLVSMIKSCRKDLDKVVAHCFTGNIEEVNDYMLLDMYVGITGWICDERRGQDLQQAVKHISLDRIMLETDAPYLLPRDLQQKPTAKNRNEPCFLPHIASAVAAHMQLDDDQLITAAYDNSQTFFGMNGLS